MNPDYGDIAADLAERERQSLIDARVAEAHRPGRAMTECADCGAPIEPERQKSLPYTGQCAACAHEWAAQLHRAIRP